MMVSHFDNLRREMSNADSFLLFFAGSDDESLAAQHARRNAQNAVNAAKEAAAAFDAAAKAQLAATDPSASTSNAPLDRESESFPESSPSASVLLTSDLDNSRWR